MSRQEDFIEAGIKYRFEHEKPVAIGGGALADMVHEMNRYPAYEHGCEHGYQYAVEKACEWLEEQMFEGDDYVGDPTVMTTSATVKSFVTQFKQAMEQ